MKAVLVIVLFCFILPQSYSWRFFHNGRLRGGNLGSPQNNNLNAVETKWFTQKLDHSDVGNPNRWQQRYFVNDEYFDQEKRNVAFLMIGGEGEASSAWMSKGAWIDDAITSNAILFQLEHRFYGQSHPTEDISTENLKFLTSEQALDDLAVFIAAINKEYNLSENVKWILYGGSYSGNLAAWARFKYPHLIDGAVSTSGPLLAVANFKDYFRVVEDDLRDISAECALAVEVGTAQIDSLLKDDAGQKQLTKIFSLCYDVGTKANDISNFYTALADNFAGIAQYNKNNRGTVEEQITLDTVCSIMTDTSEPEEINRLGNFNTLILETYDESCLNIKYDDMIEAMKNTLWDSSVSDGARQWTFQTCNEFGYYQTSDNKPQLFGDQFPLEFSIQQCIDIFGEQFNATYLDEAIDRTNINYGALDIEITNVVFVHGTVDPWHVLGITSTRSEEAPAILINGTAHCANMYQPRDEDPPQLVAARNEVSRLVQTWLAV